MFNANAYDNQEKLESMLMKLGFSPEPLQAWDYVGLPTCLLDREKNNFSYGPVVVYVVRDGFHLDFYNDIDNLFDNWSVLEGIVSETELRKKIIEAGSGLPIQQVCEAKRYFWQKAQERKNKKEKSSDDTD